MKVNDTLIWRDTCVSVFVDQDKCLVVYLNDKGNTRVINFDSNFYCVEDDIIAYYELIKDSLGVIDDEAREYIHCYVESLKNELPDGEELNLDYLTHYGIESEVLINA